MPFAPPVTNAVRLQSLSFQSSWRAVSAAWIGLRNNMAEGVLVFLILGQIGYGGNIACARSSTPDGTRCGS